MFLIVFTKCVTPLLVSLFLYCENGIRVLLVVNRLEELPLNSPLGGGVAFGFAILHLSTLVLNHKINPIVADVFPVDFEADLNLWRPRFYFSRPSSHLEVPCYLRLEYGMIGTAVKVFRLVGVLRARPARVFERVYPVHLYCERKRFHDLVKYLREKMNVLYHHVVVPLDDLFFNGFI